MYKTINGWTKKSMIEHIKKNFKGQSVDLTSNGRVIGCYYRHPDGIKKCAVGLFIPNKVYDDTMEEVSYDLLFTDYPEIRLHMPLGRNAMQKFQNVHDLTSENTLDAMLDWIEKNVK